MAYGACISAKAPAAKRITYLINPEGRVEKSWTDLKPPEHARAVIAYLQSVSLRGDPKTSA